MALETNLDVISVVKGISQEMCIIPQSRLIRYLVAPIFNFSFDTYGKLTGASEYNSYFSKTPEEVLFEQKKEYERLGLETKKEQYSWHFINLTSLKLQNDFNFNEHEEPVDLNSFEDRLYLSLEDSIDILDSSYFHMNWDRIDPNFLDKSYNWISKEIRTKLWDGDIVLFDRIDIKRKGIDEVEISYTPPPLEPWAR